MTKATNQPLDVNQAPVIVGKNGVHIDPITKRFVKGGKPVTAIASTSQGREMQQRRQETKRAAMQAAANAAVERNEWRADYGDMAFVAAIADTAMIKATTADDPKAIDAARFLLQETGLSAAQAQAEQSAGNTSPLLVLIAQLDKRGLLGTIQDNLCDTIDAQAEDVE